MGEIIPFDSEAKKKILAGAFLLAKTVKASLGGGVVFRKKEGGVLFIKEGMYATQIVKGNNPLEDLGVRIVREQAKSLEAILLMEAILQEGSQHEGELKEVLKELQQVKSHESDATITLTSGYASPYFVTHPEKVTCELESPYIYLSDKKLMSMFDVVPILEEIKGPLVILAEEIAKEALTTLVINCLKGKLPIAAVKISKQERLSLVSGKAKHILIDKEATTVMGAKIQTKNLPPLDHYPFLTEALKMGGNLEAFHNAITISLLLFNTDMLVTS